MEVFSPSFPPKNGCLDCPKAENVEGSFWIPNPPDDSVESAKRVHSKGATIGAIHTWSRGFLLLFAKGPHNPNRAQAA